MTFIIAEAGSNHNGEWSKATALIDAAVAAKCDAVKFQTFSADTLFSKYSPDFANYKDIVGIIRKNELPRHWQKDLKLYCDDRGIEFMSTPFDEQAVDELVELGVKRLKIAGFEATDPRFVKMVAKTGLPLIVSFGIGATWFSVKMIWNWIHEANGSKDLTFLHCNNAYPTPYKDISLGNIRLIKEEIREWDNLPYVKVGLSDHTRDILIPPIAVGMGAECIEKHFTLDQSLPGPDHHFAIEPHELAQMVEDIRIVETAVGIKISEYTNSEKNFKIGTRSVIALRDMKKGEVLIEENVTTKRPCTEGAIPALNYYEVLGRQLTQDVREDEILLWSMLN